jgi:hypothetical protein
MFFMGELEHGTYDDCSDLTEDEVNAFYGFDQNGESFGSNEEHDTESDSVTEDSDHEAEESGHEVEESDHEAEESDHEDLTHGVESGEPRTGEQFDTRVGIFFFLAHTSFIHFLKRSLMITFITRPSLYHPALALSPMTNYSYLNKA